MPDEFNRATDAANTPVEAGGVTIEVDCADVINYALYNSLKPIVSRVRLTSTLARDVVGAVLHIESDDELCYPFSLTFDMLPENAICEVETVKLLINPQTLLRINEKTHSTLKFSLVHKGVTLSVTHKPVTILPYDYWQGCQYYPELVASYSTPNHPYVKQIIAEAARILEKWTGSPSIIGYQSDANTALKQAGAIYAAIQKENIAYCVSPPSFEQIGQRIRTFEEMQTEKMGNCIEMSLLYAACLEYAGMNPLIVITRTHAMAGAWLKDDYFSEPSMGDGSLLLNHMANGIDDIFITECTVMEAGHSTSFDDARKMAEEFITNKQQLEYLIDVLRARMAGVSPMPSRGELSEDARTPRGERDAHTPEPRDLSRRAISPADALAALDKQTQWERKLLDFTLRNALLNLRPGKGSIPLLSNSCESVARLLDAHAEVYVEPRPQELSRDKDTDDITLLLNHASVTELIDREADNARLRTTLTASDMKTTFNRICRAAKTARDENGTDISYVAIGLLKWYDNGVMSKPYYAPIVMLPVEIQRKPADRGFTLKPRNEEVSINITLIEKLKQDFELAIPGLEPVPRLSNGEIDFITIFSLIRDAILHKQGWTVHEAAVAGNFNYGQFVMWNDVKLRKAKIAENIITKSLIDTLLAWDAPPIKTTGEFSEEGIFTPMRADTSQLRAIRAAVDGLSFVLHGPPGTGKSQTITNIIANLIARGKRVLFVAEKMAALEVVEKRLGEIELGDFCLELHSNRANIANVLKKLDAITKINAERKSEEYERNAEQLSAVRNELDAYARAVRKVLPSGVDVYTAIGRYEARASAPDIHELGEEFIDALTAGKLEECQFQLSGVIAAARAIGHPAQHPLRVIGRGDYYTHLTAEAKAAAQKYDEALAALESASAELASTINTPTPERYEKQLELIAIAGNLRFWASEGQRKWARAEKLDDKLFQIIDAANHVVNANRARALIDRYWMPSFLKLDSEYYKDKLTALDSAGALRQKGEMLLIWGRLRPHAKQTIPSSEINSHINNLYTYKTECAAAQRTVSALTDIFAEGTLLENIDWARIRANADKARVQIQICAKHPALDAARQSYAGDALATNKAAALTAAWEKAQAEKMALFELLQIKESAGEDRSIRAQRHMCRLLMDNLPKYREWIAWRDIASKARAAGLGTVIDAYEAGMAHDDIVFAFEKTLYREIAEHYISQTPTLERFLGATFTEQIRQFSEIDERCMKLERAEIRRLVAEGLPDFTQESRVNTEYALFSRAVISSGRGKSIRQLFDQISGLLAQICPCMLMSPVSVAKFLPDSLANFDYVIFDEASQLQTCRAVGALSRANAAIIVGDPNQLPPTTFFASGMADEDNMDYADLESILVDCLAINMPQSYLLWHYRSRHESLIAFSNNRFYDNALLTFPSVGDRVSKVSVRYVENGVFDRGGARNNREEARAVVAALKARCHDEEKRKQSVGVVTFSLPQQTLIEDLLIAECRVDGELDAWVNREPEPLFIKNLENVQGDERDVIIFSVGYGPDSEGRVYLNMGPLIREGGWRRLNVAVTRARDEMLVCSTLRPEQINLSRSSSRGIAALKAFLEYAQARVLSLRTNVSATAKDEIADVICEYLGSHGYLTARGVGTSKYRVDVGVLDPRNEHDYVLGILLDASAYGGDFQTTQDHELTKSGMLKRLGWNTYRIYSLDWWENAEYEKERLLRALNRLIESTPAGE